MRVAPVRVAQQGVLRVRKLESAWRKHILRLTILQIVIAALNVRAIAIDIFTRGSEITLGKRVAKEIESQIPLWEDQTQLSRVRRIAMSILSVCDRKDMPYEFKILNLDEPNAIALPGGFIYLTRGLLETVTSDDELAFVIAHEIGHVVGRHARKAISQDTIISVLASILLSGASEIIRTAADVLYTMQRLGYSRNQEREADNFALKYMQAAGYNPWGAISMLSKFADRKLNSLERYFSTHPGADERIQRLSRHLGSEVTIASLKERMPTLLSLSSTKFLTHPVCYVSGTSIFVAQDERRTKLWMVKSEGKQPDEKIIWYRATAQSNCIFILTPSQGNTHITVLTVQPDLSVQAKPIAVVSMPQSESELPSLSPDGKMLAAVTHECGSWQLVLIDLERMRSNVLPLGERAPNCRMVWQAPRRGLFIPVANARGDCELLLCDVEKGQFKSMQGWQKLHSSFAQINPQAYWADASLLIIHAVDEAKKEMLLCLDERTGAIQELAEGVTSFVIGHSGKKFALVRINNSRREIWVGDMPQVKPKMEAAKLLRASICEAMPIETREGICTTPRFSSDDAMLAYAFKPSIGKHWEVWVVNLAHRQAQRIATDAVEPQFITLNPTTPNPIAQLHH